MTPQDFDRLSAYIDNQLSPADKAKLDARLQREPELKAALTELRRLTRALRSLPTVKPPRNFTLSRAQAQVNVRPRFQLFPALRLATALAGLAFIVILSSDLLRLQFGAGGAAAPAPEAAQEVAVESAAKATTDVPSTEDMLTVAGSGMADTETPPEANFFATTETPATNSAAPAETPAPDATLDIARSALPMPTETPLPEGYLTIAQADTSVENQTPPPAEPVGWPPIRYVEIVLGVLTLFLALAAWRWRNL
jgi:hypothetical protein